MNIRGCCQLQWSPRLCWAIHCKLRELYDLGDAGTNWDLELEEACKQFNPSLTLSDLAAGWLPCSAGAGAAGQSAPPAAGRSEPARMTGG